MTTALKRRIRGLPCDECGAPPPNHCHRVVPGCEGGQYVDGNVRPLCVACHDKAHGGDGSRSFFMAQLDAAKKGARKGGLRTHELHPNQARENGLKGGRKGGLKGGRRVHELYPNLARENGLKLVASGASSAGGRKGSRRLHELYPGSAKTWLSRAGAAGGHARWHVLREITNPNCQLCQEAL
jgi:hypothetical protein